MKPKILIVDDDQEIRAQMRWALAREYNVLEARDRAKAVEVLKAEQPWIVLLDLGLPPSPGTPEEGLAALGEMLAAEPQTKVVIISGQGEKEVAIRAIGAGAYDFLGKPVDTEELKILIRRCTHVAGLERAYRAMKKNLHEDGFEGLLGVSSSMQEVFDTIRKVSTSDAPVLVLGESGTGKEMVARAIHQRSPRRDGPFVAINCGAIPEALLESELFGHEKGAYTGAHIQRKGRLEHATGGTVFLDEVGEMPTAIQVKLLRFLQERTIERVGGRAEIEVDARVLAATNVDLTAAMAKNEFREDLYYRLAVVQTTLPPLRDREGDIMLLAKSFLDQYSAESGKNGLTFGREATRVVLNHGWPGNVRELQNRVRRAVVMCDNKLIQPEDLDLASSSLTRNVSNLKDAREAVEREMIQRALRKHHGSITAAAAELEISRPTIYDLMNKLGLQKAEAKD